MCLGYLDYMKKLGYTMAHIWACPPSEGDDYIFHCHPNEQKIPKPKRLQVPYDNHTGVCNNILIIESTKINVRTKEAKNIRSLNLCDSIVLYYNMHFVHQQKIVF